MEERVRVRLCRLKAQKAVALVVQYAPGELEVQLITKLLLASKFVPIVIDAFAALTSFGSPAIFLVNYGRFIDIYS